MVEQWCDVPGYEGIYRVGSFGNVTRAARINHVGTASVSRVSVDSFKAQLKETLLKPILNERGYMWVGLHKNKIQKTHMIHKIVARAFIPNPDGKQFVNHINGIKTDNRAENLEWCTTSENMKHAFRTGLAKPTNRKISEETARTIKHLQYTKGDTEIAKMMGVTRSLCKNIRIGTAWAHV